jgi:hypothetical protein
MSDFDYLNDKQRNAISAAFVVLLQRLTWDEMDGAAKAFTHLLRVFVREDK